jgi:hypothetical protein
VGPAEGIILHYLQAFNQSFDLPLRPLNGSAYGPGREEWQARHAGDHILRTGLTVRFRRRMVGSDDGPDAKEGAERHRGRRSGIRCSPGLRDAP